MSVTTTDFRGLCGIRRGRRGRHDLILGIATKPTRREHAGDPGDPATTALFHGAKARSQPAKIAAMRTLIPGRLDRIGPDVASVPSAAPARSVDRQERGFVRRERPQRPWREAAR